jgi:predicted amidophosphoribosyltransferase
MVEVAESWWGRARAAVAELGGVVLPVECGGCGVGGISLCPGCRAGLAGPAQPLTLTTGPSVGAVWAVAPYGGEIRQVVVAWKDRGRHDLTGPLAGALAGAVLALLEHAVPGIRAIHCSADAGCPFSGVQLSVADAPVLLVPVPSSGRARRERGADVVLRLALRAARRVRAGGVPVRVLPALRLGRSVADQAGLGRSGRVRNVSGAMYLSNGAERVVSGRRCVIVDDVVTTGATVREAVRVLTGAGAVSLGVAAACATPFRRGLSVVAHLH